MSEDTIDFETHPSRYRHLTLKITGGLARLGLAIKEDGGMRPGYELKLNSYDFGVDIELADAIQRLRFEHPEVSCVMVTSDLEDVFSSGANIFMLGSSSHAFKVNFCKFTNETRLYIEDATDHSGQTYIAALNGIASGGGYELPLACKEIYLVDDRRSAVSLPEVPYLGVLPGTGGITRVVDKRKVRRDHADVFLTLAEGIKGKRAKLWNLVDDVFPRSKFDEKVAARCDEIIKAAGDRSDCKGIELPRLQVTETPEKIEYKHVSVSLSGTPRTAELVLRVPDSLPDIPADPTDLGAHWWALEAYREVDDALLRLRCNHHAIGLVVLRIEGKAETVLELDKQLLDRKDHWFVREVMLHMKRVLKRLDVTAKSFFALVDRGSCFAGSLFEFALASDRVYMLDEDGVTVSLGEMNFGAMPMGNGLTRMETQFYGTPTLVAKAREQVGRAISGEEAEAMGLVLAAHDDIDWDDEIRIVVEERVSLSPDSLTGMEANVRFAGPETVETKIFGRLSAWQNWIFQRPNAVGKKGALTLYGQPESAEFDWNRT